ncbi:class II fructose-bisphosphate aldolase [Christensenellaceae bacterium OttesenSCG-928-K19]|nr:class II fructose-bisphosphate aldolase [Christensenellaceae bacterium OttesenSCG-928-K19]
MNAKDTMLRAKEKKTVIPACNIPYIPMVKPIAQAFEDENSVAMIQVARVEWEKFFAGSLEAVAEEYEKYKKPDHTLLHLDHVPVIDEDFQKVDYMALMERAVKAGYQSAMIDASRLDLAGNIAATAQAAEFVHAAGIPLEAELGSVMGHESGEMPPYEEIFKSKQGFTDIDQAKEFVQKSGCDWLSVAAGSIHGAVAEGLKDQKKPEARLDIEHLAALEQATDIPLVLHGGSGMNVDYIRQGVKTGITKVNVGTELRQTYEQAFAKRQDVEEARQAVYEKTREIIVSFFGIKDSRTLLFG